MKRSYLILIFLVIGVVTVWFLFWFLSAGSQTKITEDLPKKERYSKNDSPQKTLPPKIRSSKDIKATAKFDQCENYVDKVSLLLHFSDEIKTKIVNLVEEKLIQGYDPQAIFFYLDTIYFIEPIPKLLTKLTDKQTVRLENNLWHYHTNLQEIITFIDEGDIEAAEIAWNKLMETPELSNFPLEVSSTLFFTSPSTNKKVIDNRLEAIDWLVGSIPASVLLNYPAKNPQDYILLEKKYKLNFTEKKNFGSLSILSMAVIYKKRALVDFFLTKENSTQSLNTAFRFALWQATDMALLHKLWDRGARIYANVDWLLDLIRIKHPDDSLVEKIELFQKTNPVYPFDESILWQLNDLKSEIEPLLIENERIKNNISNTCEAYLFNIDAATLNKITLQARTYFKQKLDLETIESLFAASGKSEVEAFRRLFSEAFNQECNSQLELSDMSPDNLISGNLKAIDCYRNNSLLTIAFAQDRAFWHKFSSREVVDFFPPTSLLSVKMDKYYIQKLLVDLDAFDKNNWDLSTTDKQHKTLFYYSFVFNNLNSAKLLLEKGHAIDGDPYGWDAMDYFIVNAYKFKDLDDWIKLLNKIDWELKPSYLSNFNHLQKYHPEEALQLLEKLNIATSFKELEPN